MKAVTSLFIFFFLTCFCFSQTENMNFEFGNFDNWILDTGVRVNPTNIDWNPRPANDINTQIELTSPATEPFDENGLDCMPTMLNLPTVFPGGAFSTRIGNIAGGRRAARISRSFVVTPESSFLQYSYAVIMDDPGHDQNDQPKFVINIKDIDGNIVTCGQFEAFAGPNAEENGFTNCTNSDLQILPWTTAGADLTPFLGQQITIEFLALDCMLGAHGGYAYVEATLEPLEIQVEGLCIEGDQITLTAPLGFTSYLWSTGETTRSITVAASEFGQVYSVDLISNTGCNTSATRTLEPVNPATIDPIPDQEICQGGSVLIIPTGENIGDFYFPDFDSSGNSIVLSPDSDTTYTVVARDENGCPGESTTFTITVIPSDEPPFPNADFEIEPIIAAGENPCNTIQLVNLSGYCKGDLNYLWDFGDGTTSTEQNPIHSFPFSETPETYFITLTVTSSGDGLSDATSREYRTSSINADFFAEDNCGIVSFTNLSTICGAPIDDFPSFTYTWDFGDGSPTLTTDNTQATFNHTYNASGLYTILLTMEDMNGDTSVMHEVMLEVTAEANADFEFFLDCFDVQFQDTSFTCDPIVSYEWDFGDGSPISNETAPLHTYTTVGPHPVTLTINDGTTSLQQTYNVTLMLDETVPNFNFTVSCNEVTFQNLSNSCVSLTYEWNFGDGSPANFEENPIHQFEYDNSYEVTLTVNDGTQDYSVQNTVMVLSEFLYETPLNLDACAANENAEVAIFNLNEQTDYILSNINPNGPFYPLVTYHLNNADAMANTARIDFNYENTSNPQEIFARIEDSQGCAQFFPFSLRVNTVPTVNQLENISLCNLNENTETYDLTQLNAMAFEGIDQENINLSYHTNERDATTRENAVTTINLIAGEDNTIYIRAENAEATTCFSIGTFMIRMDNENTDAADRCMPFFSNTMTPNGDGANDTFFIQNIETFPNNDLTIYNRWGAKVFETTGYNNDWNGTFNGKPLPVGTYYYHIKLNDTDNRVHSGYISILR